MTLLGVDFTSAPRRRKPITVAHGHLDGATLRFEELEELVSFEAFETMLLRAGPWLGGFDFPFGLPRTFVESLELGTSSEAVIASLMTRCGNRMGLRRCIDEWGNSRPKGQRLLHRQTDKAMSGVTSSSPLQTRYVPVGFMYFEGMSRLVAADVNIPGLRPRGAARTAIEAYPGLLAYELVGRRSYKNKDEPDRLIARKDIVDALEQGRPARLGLRLKLTHAQRDTLVADGSGDRLDAVLCLVQAAWAAMQPRHGLPPEVDAIEGWIATAPWPAPAPASPGGRPTQPREKQIN